MKIFIIPSWYPSRIRPASGAFFMDWAHILSEEGHDVTVIVNILHSIRNILQHRLLPHRIDNPTVEFNMQTFRREAINPYPRLPGRSFDYYRNSLVRQFQTVLQHTDPPDIILIHSAVWAGAATADLLATAGIPFVVVEHVKGFLRPGDFKRFQLERIRNAYRHARFVVSVSSALDKRLQETFPELGGRTRVIHNPVGAHILRHSGERAALDPDFTFVAVSYFRPEKRLDLLLAAFARLVQEGRPVRLRMVGSGPLRRDLHRQVRRLNLGDRVEFSGDLPRDQVPRELYRSHCLVMPSDLETFGLALVEALACGRPVIATRCGGPEDIVTPETGLLIPPDDTEALYQAMCRMMDRYTDYDPDVLCNYARETFSPQVYAQAWGTLFAEAVVPSVPGTE